MARDGNGVYDRDHDWTNDLANAIPVTASRFDAENDGFATALTGSIAADGQTSITANLKMSGFKHTGVANGSAATDYAALGQLQSNTGVYVITTGSANAYVATPSPAIGSLIAGQRFILTTNFANTAAATLAVSGLAATAIVDSEGAALTGAEIASGQEIEVVYDGTSFVIISPLNPVESLVIAASDEATAITTGTAKVTFRMPYAFNLKPTGVKVSMGTAPTGSVATFDINEGGTTILSTKITVDATEKTSTTAATPPVISDLALANDGEITIDFDGVGSTIAGAGVKVTLIGRRA